MSQKTMNTKEQKTDSKELTSENFADNLSPIKMEYYKYTFDFNDWSLIPIRHYKFPIELKPLGLPIKFNCTYSDKVNYPKSIIERGFFGSNQIKMVL